MIALAIALSAAAAAAPRPLGVWEAWGAFADTAPRRCYAIAAPVARQADDAFAAVANWPGAAIRSQLHVRLSHPRNPRSAVTLALGDRRFVLTAGARDAWAPDAASDRAIVAAMRSSRSMSVESVSTAGRPFADVYRLAGAATAIDAARLGCVKG